MLGLSTKMSSKNGVNVKATNGLCLIDSWLLPPPHLVHLGTLESTHGGFLLLSSILYIGLATTSKFSFKWSCGVGVQTSSFEFPNLDSHMFQDDLAFF